MYRGGAWNKFLCQYASDPARTRTGTSVELPAYSNPYSTTSRYVSRRALFAIDISFCSFGRQTELVEQWAKKRVKVLRLLNLFELCIKSARITQELFSPFNSNTQPASLYSARRSMNRIGFMICAGILVQLCNDETVVGLIPRKRCRGIHIFDALKKQFKIFMVL